MDPVHRRAFGPDGSAENRITMPVMARWRDRWISAV
jgi:hypothetical protein